MDLTCRGCPGRLTGEYIQENGINTRKEKTALKKIKRRFRRWKKWKKYSLNCPVAQFFVLLGIWKSRPPFSSTILEEEIEENHKAKWEKILKKGEDADA